MATRGYLSDEQRGDFGAWLLKAMGELTFEQLAADMAEAGHVHDPAYYRAMASGAKPGGRVIRQALYDHFGTKPAAVAPPADQATLVSALDRQTDAIRALVDAIARERAEGRDVVTAFDRAVEALLSGRQPVDSEASEGQRALRESTR